MCTNSLVKQKLSDFGIILNNIPLYCDNTSAIILTKNPIMHSCTKHIEIIHHFLCEHIENGNYEIKFIRTEKYLLCTSIKSIIELHQASLNHNICSISFLFFHFFSPISLMASPSQKKKRSRGSSSTSRSGYLEIWFTGYEEVMTTFLHKMSRKLINIPKKL